MILDGGKCAPEGAHRLNVFWDFILSCRYREGKAIPVDEGL
jgi:hypothetical protein